MQATPMTLASGVVTHAMELSQLQGHIRTLITLEEDEALVVSCYVHRDVDLKAPVTPFESRLRMIRKALVGQELDHFEERFGRIQHFLAAGSRNSAALRSGKSAVPDRKERG